MIAYQAVFGFVALQDDESYVIVSLREFTSGASYADVNSQYGPGLFSFVGSLFDLAGIPLTSDGARMFNLALWLLSTLLLGLTLLRITRSFPVAAGGLLVAFLVLIVDANEPLHPGAAIGLLLVAVVAAASLFESRPALALGLVGGCVGTLLSLKVNVGGFACVSIAFACALTAPAVRRGFVIRGLASVAFAAVPVALMWSRLYEANTFHLAAITTISALALVVIAFGLRPRSGPSGRDLVWLVAGAASVLAVAALVPVIAGTSPGELLDSWVVRPARVAGIAFAPVPLGTTGIAWAGLGLATAVATTLRLRSPGPSPPRWRAALGTARLLIGLLIWLSLTGSVLDLPLDLERAMAVAAPFAWVAAIAPEGSRFDATLPRLLIPALAILQVLHGYPIPGSQFAWGQLLYAVVGGVCVADGVGELTAAGRALTRPVLWRPAALTCVVAFGAWVCFVPLHRYSDRVHAAYAAGVSLDLPGAQRVRLPQVRVETLHAVIRSLSRDCETYLSLPGLNSFYLFTGEQPPAVLMGPWPWVLTADDQREILREVRDLPSLCVVRQDYILAVWGIIAGDVPDRPLVRFIERRFRTVDEYGGYEVQVRRR